MVLSGAACWGKGEGGGVECIWSAIAAEKSVVNVVYLGICRRTEEVATENLSFGFVLWMLCMEQCSSSAAHVKVSDGSEASLDSINFWALDKIRSNVGI